MAHNLELEKVLAMYRSPDVRNKHLAVDIIESNQMGRGMDELVDVVRMWYSKRLECEYYQMLGGTCWFVHWFYYFVAGGYSIGYTVTRTWRMPDILSIDIVPSKQPHTHYHNHHAFRGIVLPANITSEKLQTILNDHSRAIILDCFDFRNNRWHDKIWITRLFPLFNYPQFIRKP